MRRYPDVLVFYRMGDFYELFFDDARKAARLLDITLTARGQAGGTPVPMAGVPVQTRETHLARALRKGESVAICEPMGDPAKAKGAPGRARRHAGHGHRRGPARGTSLDGARGAVAQWLALRARLARARERSLHDALRGLQLTDSESSAFIPVYDEYQAEQKKLADRTVDALNKFAANY